MMKSLFSGVSGLKNHQTAMDVIGNNIANVNTTAYKANRVIFKDIVNQTVSDATSASGNSGGKNPSQIGLGMAVSTIAKDMTEGSAQSTDVPLDFSVQGEGYFVVLNADGETYSYTRNGNFNLDSNGNLVTASGQYVMGIVANDAFDPTNMDGTVNSANFTKLQLLGTMTTTSGGKQISVKCTDYAVDTYGIVSCTATVPKGATVLKTVNVKDSFSDASTATISGFTNFNAGTITTTQPAKFNITGSSHTGTTTTFTAVDSNGVAYTATVDDTDIVTAGSTSDTSTLTFTGTDGTTVDATLTVTRDDTTTTPAGSTSAAYTKDNVLEQILTEDTSETITVGRLVLSTFNNAAGLSAEGNSNYAATVNSGNPTYNFVSSDCGAIQSGQLEMSNVSLATEMTNMIIMQRGFQANSRVITTSDTMLEELVNLKR